MLRDKTLVRIAKAAESENLLLSDQLLALSSDDFIPKLEERCSDGCTRKYLSPGCQNTQVCKGCGTIVDA